MSCNFLMTLGFERTVNADKVLDTEYTATFACDAGQTKCTTIPATAVDQQIDLYESGLVVEGTFLLIKTSVPLQVRLGLIGNTQIEVNSYMLLTDPATTIFVTVPGTEDAVVEMIYGGAFA